MPSRPEFARATVADIPLLRELAARIWRAHYPPIIGHAQTEHMLARMYAPETIRCEIEELGVVWEIASIDGEAVGYLAWAHEPASASVKLAKLYLDPSQHGRGVGAAMLARAEAAARALGAARLYLFVNKGNAKAIRAYERNGFAIEESVVADFDGYPLDDWRMAKPLA